ncbi:ExbD/TolR family protein [Pseudoroseicyclus sp. CLL3-39]|uniref:ExbD/TolR family protein n=1 Tax=Pseudoroseicyclus tamaricis TaxID=2705421 RepID=A0A6B2JK56_9RHOB|nr:ExbD/TolR family protein [Pseudoroseicyclus tamaricis]
MGAGVQKKAEGGGGRRRRRGRAVPMAEINVTPFVDVMLVLLIIFMVAAPLMTVGVPVELPETAAGALPSDQEEPLTVTITAEGQVLIQTTEIPPEELIPRLSAIAAERTSDRIFLRADGANAWARVAEIMGALNAGGFTNIGLVTDPGGPTLDGGFGAGGLGGDAGLGGAAVPADAGAGPDSGVGAAADGSDG